MLADPAPHYQVLVNHEEQYGLFPAGLQIPDGWQAVGHQDTEAACRAYVDTVWHDTRPLSLRRALEH
ncbi:MbtH family protein [Streptomyces sp. NPDC001339]|uniref:MbtH family protein n=1 Tax=Streptomyces sp. NPDC001339 TaxID=3364563 RepID=UPI0036C13E4E